MTKNREKQFVHVRNIKNMTNCIFCAFDYESIENVNMQMGYV